MKPSVIRTAVLLVGGLFFVGATTARADVVHLGVISFNTFIIEDSTDGIPGVNAFNISNYTGGSSLPPDFPVIEALVFQSPDLKLNPPGTNPVPSLPDIGPGTLEDVFGNPVVQEPSTDSFNSAEFTATLNTTVFKLNDGNIFTADSASIDVQLVPSVGPNLTADTDSAVISVSGTISAAVVPEPASWSLLLVILAALAIMFRKMPGPATVPVKPD